MQHKDNSAQGQISSKTIAAQRQLQHKDSAIIVWCLTIMCIRSSTLLKGQQLNKLLYVQIRLMRQSLFQRAMQTPHKHYRIIDGTRPRRWHKASQMEQGLADGTRPHRDIDGTRPHRVSITAGTRPHRRHSRSQPKLPDGTRNLLYSQQVIICAN